MDGKCLRHFTFGVEVSPKWFLQKVQSKDVEYIKVNGRIVGCRFYNVYTREEQIMAIGDIITSDMLYPEGTKQ